ncbi:hypothetical protein ACWD04_33240 [Streptomyces sp. NPDC002911]
MANRIDCLALARGLDVWSWVESSPATGTPPAAGNVRTHPLRQVLADVAGRVLATTSSATAAHAPHSA